MTEFRATLAIVRRHIDRRFAIDWAMQFALVAGIAFGFSAIWQHTVAGVAIVSTLAAASAGERSHADALRRVTFFAMPLFGRQLARAHAVAPLLLGCAIPLGYAAGSALRRHALGAEDVAALFLAALVATLISLSSIFRDGYRAWLYVALAAVAGTTVGALPRLPAISHGLQLASAVAVLCGFFALRAFGETLARYDPLPA